MAGINIQTGRENSQFSQNEKEKPTSDVPKAKKLWEEMERLLSGKKEFKEMGIRGRLILFKMGIEEKKEDGADAVKALMEELGDLYKQAIRMRANMFPDVMKKATGATDTMSLEVALTKDLGGLMDSQNTDFKALGDELSLMAKGLADNPADILDRNAKSRYWVANGSYPDIKQGAVDTDLQTIWEIRNDEALAAFIRKNPDAQKNIDQLVKGLQLLKRVNPPAAMQYAWQKQYTPRSMDTRPLRALGMIGFGGLALIGVGYSLLSKSEVNKLTLAYGGAAYLLAYPNALDPKAKKALAALDQFNQKELKFVRKFNEDAIDELKAVNRTNKNNVMKILTTIVEKEKLGGTGALTGAQSGLITDGNPKLKRVWDTLSNEEKLQALERLWPATGNFLANAKEVAKISKG